MKKVFMFVVSMFLGLLVLSAKTSYAHTYVDVDFDTWPSHHYYWGYPYYDYDWDDYYYPYYHHPYYYSYYSYYAYPNYVVAAAPVAYQPVVINGMTYYLNNGVYYVYTQYGYQAVATPAGAPQPQSTATAAQPVASTTQQPEVAPTAQATVTASDDAITVNIPNRQGGGYTPVVLKKSGKGFVGPQGEYYAEFPKVSQLQTMYGK